MKGVPHGEHSYTVPVPCGKMRKIAKISVLLRNSAFRVETPTLTKAEGASVKWGEDPQSAWDLAVQKAAAKFDSMPAPK